MSDEIERLLVRVEANAQQFEAQMKRVNKQLWASQAANRKALEKMRADTADVGRRLGMDLNSSLKNALMGGAATIAAGFSVDAIKNYADGYTRYTNQLKVAGLEGENLARVQGNLFEIAQKYGIELESLGTLYSRSSQAAKDLGASETELMRFTTGVSAALKVQGGDASASAGALLQLSQALGGGIVRAEEFNSIMEGARPIAQAVANGIDRYKGSISALRNDIVKGKVTSQDFFQGFLKGSKDLEAQAEKSNLTIAASLTVLNNALGKYIGEADSNLSATQKFAGAIRSLADNLDILVPVVLTIIGLVGSRYAAAMLVGVAANARMFAAVVGVTAAISGQTVAMTAAQAASLGLGRVMLAAFGGPLGLAIAAIGAGLLYVTTQGNKTAIAARELKRAQDALAPTLEVVEENLRKAAEASDDVKAAHLRAANAALAQGRAEIAAARMTVQAAKAKVEALEQERIARANSGGYSAAKVGNPASYTEASGRLEAAEARLRGLEDAQISAGLAERRGSRGRGTYLHYKSAEEMFAERTGGGASSAPPGDKPKKGRKDTGPTPEELARRKKAAELAWELEKAEASGLATSIRAAESAQWIFQREEQLHDQGMTWAAAAEQALKDRIALNEIEIGQAERLNAVKAVDVGSDAGIVSGALDGVSEDLVDQEAALRETFRTTFGDGIRAALQGDLDGYFMSLADRFSDRLIDNLSDQLFDLLNQYAKSTGGSGEGNWFGTAVSWIAKAFGGNYAGGYANGGDFGGGQWATVGERGPEAIYAKPGGGVKVLSNGALTAMRKSASDAAAVAPAGAPSFTFDMRGAVMTEDLLRDVNQRVAVGMEIAATRGAARAARALPGAQARKARSQVPR